MKKIFALMSLALTTLFVSAQSTSPMFGIPPSGDNTGGSITYSYAKKAYTATLALKPTAFDNIYRVDTLTGAMTVTLATAAGYVGSRVEMTFICDTLTAGRVVTFTTGTKNSGTLTVAKSKHATIGFIFNGLYWVELTRARE